MAAFIEKTDFFGIADGTTLVCVSSEDGKSAEVAEAIGQDGSIVENNVYGVKIAPSNKYLQKGDWEVDDGDINLGDINALDSTTSVCLNNISIGTTAGSAPTISVSGEQVENGSTMDCHYEIPAFELTKKHHAQILMSAFSFSGNAHLTSASYDFTSNISKAEKDGDCLAHDVTEGKIEISVEFLQTGANPPTITAGTGWVITSPLACSNPDADWPTWSATLTKYLSKAATSSQT